MENIVAHSLEKLYTEFERADQLFLDSGMKDMDAYEEGLAEAARRAAAEHMQALYNSMDRMLCDDILRNAKYTIQRHDTRELLTVNGPVRFNHTLFRNREDGGYHYLLDEWLGVWMPMRGSAVPRRRLCWWRQQKAATAGLQRRWERMRKSPRRQ